MTEQESEELASRLREAREFANLSQQFVAKQTGIPRSAISDIERGVRRVESLELKRFADLYRMPLSYFLRTGDEEMAGAAEDDPFIKALARAAKEMNEHERGEVLRFALFLRNFENREADESD
jgi:transcriptional regulator with XRE-family HTH domain